MTTPLPNRPLAYPPVPTRRWFQSGTYSFYLLCIVLLIIARATYWLVVKEYQTRQLYILAEQLGFTEDSQVLRTRDWYCTEWSLIGQQNCRVFLVYTTTYTGEQMQSFTEKFKRHYASDNSNALQYVLSDLKQFLPDITYVVTNSVVINTENNHAITKLEWWLNDIDYSLVNSSTMYFYGTANMSPPFLLAGKPIKENIVVLYGKAKTTWLF